MFTVGALFLLAGAAIHVGRQAPKASARLEMRAIPYLLAGVLLMLGALADALVR